MNRRSFLKASIGAGAALGFSRLPAVYAAGNMRCYVQWARNSPGDWTNSDAGLWASSHAKADPVGDTTDPVNRGDALLNNSPGWIFAINVQGVEFAWYDHYYIADLTDGSQGTRVTAWIDDLSEATGFTLRRADVWTFLPLSFDPRVGGTNTRQTSVWYREGAEYDALVGNPSGGVSIARYADFVPPTANVKHGIYVSDSKWAEHQAARTLHGWREWAG